MPDFLKVACKSITSGKDIANLFRKLKDDDKKNKYDLQYISAFSSSIKLGNTFEITCLSPSSREENDYPKSNNENYYDTDNDANNPKANLLSTVLKITDKNSEIENVYFPYSKCEIIVKSSGISKEYSEQKSLTLSKECSS